MSDNTSTSFGSTLAIEHSQKQISISPLSIEKITLYISIIGPMLLVLLLVLTIPKIIEFGSLSTNSHVHQFTDEYRAALINIMYLLFATSIFSLFGLMLYYVYKKNILLIFNFISLFITFGMFIPTYIMIIGD